MKSEHVIINNNLVYIACVSLVWLGVSGDCDGMTYQEIEEMFPEEFQRRKVDKLAYRYPR